MIFIFKLAFIFIPSLYIYHSFKKYNLIAFKENKFYKDNYNQKNCNHSYKYSKTDEYEYRNEKGERFKMYICKFCGNKFFEKISTINKNNYLKQETTFDLQIDKEIKYYSDLSGNYTQINDEIHFHSIYGNKCKKCHELIGEFDFKSLGNLKCTGYPRLIKLSKYWKNTWILGGNFGNNVGSRISKDQGLSWTEPAYISKLPDHICSNINLFELPNHDIIASYRAIGRFDIPDENIKYSRKIGSSISHDGGYTWENLGNIVDNFELAEKLGKTRQQAIKAVKDDNRIGFFEPFLLLLNNKITVFYADDFTPMINKTINDDPFYNFMVKNIYSQVFELNNQIWSEERNLVVDGSTKKSPTNSGLEKRISKEGMPAAVTMKDGTIVIIFEGTYRDQNYPLLTGKYLNNYKWTEILLSYSKDGSNWSNPVEIYVSKKNNTKSSAPFVVCNDNNQLIVSFQTDEDSYDFGYEGDIYSIMKIMISKPGIPIERINQNSFYALCNNNNSPIGSVSIWNGLMLLNNILYTVSSDNTIKYSEIPIYDEPSKYNEKLKENYIIIKGEILTYGDKIISQSEEIFIINKIINTSITNLFYTYVIPNCDSNFGLIFGLKDYKTLDKYYIFQINEKGNLTLLYNKGGRYKNLIPNENKYIQNYNKNNTYKMEIYYNPLDGYIITFINDRLIYYTKHLALKGNKVGFVSYGKNIIIKQILSEQE